MYDPSEKRIEKLFNSLITEINKCGEEDGALSTSEIISALSEVIVTVNNFSLEQERDYRNSLN